MQIKETPKLPIQLDQINENYGLQNLIFIKLIEKFLTFVELKVPFLLHYSQPLVHNEDYSNTNIRTNIFH